MYTHEWETIITCIVWKGRYLVADTQLTDSADVKSYCRKLWPIANNGVLAIAGDVDAEFRFKSWFLAGSDIEKWPEGKWKYQALHIDRWGDVYEYCNGPEKWPVDHPYAAIGCGGKFAIPLLQIGYSAKEAVELVGEINVFCNSLVDVYDIKTQKLVLSKFPTQRKVQP
jgi:hypothetical protein